MRLLRLNLQKYGHFSQLQIDLPPDGLTLIHGPNEAGKSTLLQFVREVLFGFPSKDHAYDFGGGGKLEGRAVLQLANGQTVELRRTKAKKDNLYLRNGDGERAASDAELSELLGGASSQTFQNVFGFGLKELASATGNKDVIKSASYSAGLSASANPLTLLTTLGSDAEKLFKPRGTSGPQISKILVELTDLTKQVTTTTRSAEEYERLTRELEEAKAAAQSAHAELGRLRKEHALQTRIAAALPIWQTLQALRRELQSIAVPPGFPLDGARRFETLQKQLAKALHDQRRHGLELQQATEHLQSLPTDFGILEYKAAVERVQQLLESVKDARRDLPLVEAKAHGLERSIALELQELTAGWELADLEQFGIDVAAREQIKQLAREERETSQAEAVLRPRVDEQQSRLSQITHQLSQAPALPDSAPLAALVAEIDDYSARGQYRETLRKDAAKQRRQIAAQLARLNPPCERNDAEEVCALPVPPAEVAARFAREFADHEERVRGAEQSFVEERDRAAALERQLAGLVRPGQNLPTRIDLADLRARRDAAAAVLQTSATHKPPVGDVPPVATGEHGWSEFRRLVLVADRAADDLFENAEAVWRREDLAAAQARIESQRLALEELQRQQLDLEQRWRAAWQPCGFAPLAPEAMLGWLEKHRALCEHVERVGATEAEVRDVELGLEEVETRARTLLGSPESNGPALLACVRATAQRAAEDRQALEALRRDLALTEAALAEAQQKLTALATRQADWSRRWHAILARFRLPGEWPVDLAPALIERLQRARGDCTQLTQQRERMTDMRHRIGQLEESVAQVWRKLHGTPLDQPAEAAAAALYDQMSRAVALQERRASLAERASSLERELALAGAEQAEAHRGLTELLALAQVSTPPEFAEVAERSAERQRLLDEVRTHERELRGTAGPGGEASLEPSLRTADPHALRDHLESLQQQVVEQEARFKESTKNTGQLETLLGRNMDGGDAAAALQEQVAGKQAQLAAAVHRYVPLVFARRLLQSCVTRVQRECQPAVLAEASRIFEHMTEGRYVKIERPLGETDALLIHRADQETFDHDALSTGSREQLYLALRMAYVVQYCQQNEPLPIILDDVLANFDAERSRRTLRTLADMGALQTLLFTCHPHIVELAREELPDLPVIELERPALKV